MMYFRWFAPTAQPLPEVLEAHDLTRRFHREVEQRQEFDRYCQWYRATAARNRQELQKMQGDVNMLGWFNRRFRP
jgi:hypothetical protein